MKEQRDTVFIFFPSLMRSRNFFRASLITFFLLFSCAKECSATSDTLDLFFDTHEYASSILLDYDIQDNFIIDFNINESDIIVAIKCCDIILFENLISSKREVLDNQLPKIIEENRDSLDQCQPISHLIVNRGLLTGDGIESFRPLVWAIENEDFKLAQDLLRQNVNVLLGEKLNQGYKTPLSVAIECGPKCDGIAHELIERGAHTVQSPDYIASFKAVSMNSAKWTGILLNQLKDQKELYLSMVDACLEAALTEKRYSVVINIVKQSQEGSETIVKAVLHAIDHNNGQLIQMFLMNDIMSQSVLRIALKASVQRGNSRILRLLLSVAFTDLDFEHSELLRLAMVQSRMDLFATLILNGASFSSENEHLLQYAVKNKHYEFVKFMLDEKFRHLILKQNDAGFTLTYHSKLKKNADLNAVNGIIFSLSQDDREMQQLLYRLKSQEPLLGKELPSHSHPLIPPVEHDPEVQMQEQEVIQPLDVIVMDYQQKRIGLVLFAHRLHLLLNAKSNPDDIFQYLLDQQTYDALPFLQSHVSQSKLISAAIVFSSKDQLDLLQLLEREFKLDLHLSLSGKVLNDALEQQFFVEATTIEEAFFCVAVYYRAFSVLEWLLSNGTPKQANDGFMLKVADMRKDYDLLRLYVDVTRMEPSVGVSRRGSSESANPKSKRARRVTD